MYALPMIPEIRYGLFRSWSDYQKGFGEPQADHWISLEVQRGLTKDRSCHLQAVLELDVTSPYNRLWCAGNYRSTDCNGQVSNTLDQGCSNDGSRAIYGSRRV